MSKGVKPAWVLQPPAGARSYATDAMPTRLDNLEDVLAHIKQARTEHDQVSLGAVVQTVGTRSFGPLLLLAGVLTVSPLSGIPGMPTLMGVMVLLVSTQMLAGRGCFWLPGWLVRRSVSRSKLEKALGFMQRPARFIDRGLRPRLHPLIGPAGERVIALVCTVLGLSMPPMEVVPFSVNGVGAILIVFGLALIGRDGVFALAAFALTLAFSGGLAYTLIGLGSD